MTKNTTLSRRFPGLVGAAALIGLPIVAVVWWSLRREPEPAPVVERPAASAVLPAVPAPPVPAPPTENPAPPPERSPAMPPIAPANSGEPHAEGMLPHPITPEHERIFRENTLVGSLNGAMDARDVSGMRALLKQYRDEFPEDDNVMQEGYQLIADCLEKPGPATRAAAQRYYDERIDSGLRRYLRRHCLEASP